jgi:hypothetical protein
MFRPSPRTFLSRYQMKYIILVRRVRSKLGYRYIWLGQKFRLGLEAFRYMVPGYSILYWPFFISRSLIFSDCVHGSGSHSDRRMISRSVSVQVAFQC